MTQTPEEMQKAIDLSKRIERKVHNLLEPLDLEIRIMKWRPEYRSLMWESVWREAMRRGVEATNLVDVEP